MTFEDFYKLNKSQLQRLLKERAFMSMIKLAWGDGFRMGYGAAYFLPMSSHDKKIEKNLKGER